MTSLSDRTLSNGPMPLYAQIAEDLRARIRRGEIAVGAELPSLHDICDLYGVSRIAARQAVARLVEQGLVSSARGRRAVVLRNDMEGKRPLFETVEPNLGMAPDHTITILSRAEAAALPEAAGFHGSSCPPYVVIRKVHGEGGAPYCLMDGYVAKPLFETFPPGAERRRKLARLAFDHASPPLVSGRERLLVAAADATEAGILDIPVGAPVARIQRVFCDAEDRILYYGEFVYRGDRFGSERDLTSYVLERW